MRKRLQLKPLVAAGLLLAAGGCLSIQSTPTRGKVTLNTAASSEKAEQREGDIQGSAFVEGSTITVELVQPEECRTVRITPTAHEVSTENTLTGAGTASVVLMSLGGAALVGMGIAGVASTCPPVTGTDKEGNTFDNECLPDDETRQTTFNIAGGIAIGGGVLLGVFAIANGVRAVDEIELVDGKPKREPGPWKRCGGDVVANKPIVVVLGDGTKLEGRTSEKGVAHVDLADVDPSSEILDNPIAKVTVHGKQVGAIDLSEHTLFDEWTAALDEHEEEYEASLAKAREKRKARAKKKHEAAVLARANAKLEGLRKLSKDVKSLGSPWTTEKLKSYLAIPSTLKAVALTEEEEASLAKPETKEYAQLATKLLKKVKDLMPSFTAEMKKRHKERRAWEASPEGRRASCMAKCDFWCGTSAGPEQNWEKGECYDLGKRCTARCENRKATCMATCATIK